jgi:hypothetical protein
MNDNIYPLVHLNNLINKNKYSSYFLEIKIMDKDNNCVIINTDAKNSIEMLPKDINVIINTYLLLQDFITRYDNNYFLSIYIKYFDGFIESFFIEAIKLKMMFLNFNINNFIKSKHYIKYNNFENYIEKLGGTITEICKRYNHIDKNGFENVHIKYIEFYIDKQKILGCFHDMSCYNIYKYPYATFSIIL